MKRNVIKIRYNPFGNTISYSYKNEMGEWLLLSGSSPLSRQRYTKTNIRNSCLDIVGKINEVYNRKEKGLDILFEGVPDDYKYLSDIIKNHFRNHNITCKMQPTRIAIIGKKGVGKTFLIEGIAKANDRKFVKTDNGQYVKYEDGYNNVEWVEVKGIDIGSEYVEETYHIISDLVNDGLSKVIYCVSGITGRIEEMEKSLMSNLKKSFPSIDVITAVTMCYKDDVQVQEAIDEIEKYVGNETVFPLLAQEYKLSAKASGMADSYVVEPFGLNELTTFVFEGKKLSYKLSKKLVDSKRIEKQPQNVKSDGIRKSSVSAARQIKEAKVSKEIQVKQQIYEKKENALVGSEKQERLQGIAVVGKKAVGKTTLIEGCGEFICHSFTSRSYDGYQIYEDNFLMWYEIKGIDLGKEKIDEVFSIVTKLAVNNMTHMIYCVSGETVRMEKAEKDFIFQIKQTLPKMKVFVVLTKCYKDGIPEIVKELERIVGKGNVVQTLAKAYKCGIKNQKTGQPFQVEAYGLELIYDKIRGEISEEHRHHSNGENRSR